MKKRPKVGVIILALVVIILILFIGKAVVKEKYCYSFGFAELERMGIQLGELGPEYKGTPWSPIQVGGVHGQKEWWDTYVGCLNNFNVFNINLSVFIRSDPDYRHFIDW